MASDPVQFTKDDQTPDFSAFIPRIKQVEWDHYYMEVALAVRHRANCTGAHVAAVLVFNNRIISTGFNGTPSGFPNCSDGGCERCRQRELPRMQRDTVFRAEGKHLDLCICVHAEANAFLSAAREGIRTAGATLYATHKPCFTCLKEAVQAGVERVVYLYEYDHGESKNLRKQYEMLAEHLRRNDQRNFEPLAAQSELPGGNDAHPRDPNLDEKIVAARKPKPASPEAKPAPGRRASKAQSNAKPSKSAQS